MLAIITLLACQPQLQKGTAAPDDASDTADTGTATATAEDTGRSPFPAAALASSPLGTIQVEEGPPSITVTLTDAPGDFEAVPITVGGVSVMTDDKGEVVLVDKPSEWDLLQLQNGVTGVLGAAELEVADFEQVRLLVTEASVIVDGEEHKLQIPSGQQSGIKIPYVFSVEAGIDYELRLDFDAHESIRQTGNGRYQMSPVVKVEYFGELQDEASEDKSKDEEEEKSKDEEEEK